MEQIEFDIITDSEEESRELTTYSYVSNYIHFEYFVGYEIASLLGYKNTTQVVLNNVSKCNQLVFKDYPGVKIPDLDPRTILITAEGAIEILIKTRKRISPDVLYLLKTFGIETTNRKCLTKEQQTLSAITNAFKTEKFEDQFKVDSYYLDLYFPEYKIVVEADENGHSDRDPIYERKRMDVVNEILGINDDNWVRYNPDEHDFDISKVIGRIYRKIDELKKKTYVFESKETDDSLTRVCNICKEEKELHRNFLKYGTGYRSTCIDCNEPYPTGKEKPIKQYNLDGTFVKKYPSIKKASQETKIASDHIGRACREIIKAAGGFMWRFVKEEKKVDEHKIEIDEEKNTYEESKIEPDEESKIEENTDEESKIDKEKNTEIEEENENTDEEEKIEAVNYETKKPVAQYNKDGKLIKIHTSVADACKELGVKPRSVYGAIRNNFVSHGYVWRYIENDKLIQQIEPVTPHRKYMKQVEIYKDGELFKNFISIRDSAKEMKVNISMCRKYLDGRKQDPKGYEWKFKEN